MGEICVVGVVVEDVDFVVGVLGDLDYDVCRSVEILEI